MKLGKEKISEELLEKYDFYDYNYAIDILQGSFSECWKEIQESLLNFEILIEDLKAPGGNKSPIPKKLDNELFPKNWEETRIKGELNVTMEARTKREGKYSNKPIDPYKEYIDGHNIDFVKEKVAFDVEWNSKDQTFDRDLMAMRTYYECNLISVGVILTRADELDDVFKSLYYINSKNNIVCLHGKYGESTTHIGKLTSRLEGRRNGGCPILAIGIKKNCVVDWDDKYIDPLIEKLKISRN